MCGISSCQTVSIWTLCLLMTHQGQRRSQARQMPWEEAVDGQSGDAEGAALVVVAVRHQGVVAGDELQMA